MLSIPQAKSSPSPSSKPSFGKKGVVKKKTQLEMFKEEIKAQHDAREAMKEKQREKAKLTGQTIPASFPAAASDQVYFICL